MRTNLLRRHALAAMACFVCVFTMGSASFAAAPPIYVNGTQTAVSAIVRNNQVFVPVRGVFEQLHADVAYNAPRTVVARKAGSELVNLTLGSRNATVQGANRTLQTAPFMSASRAFVPLRLIGEAAGATVVYSAVTRTVHIDDHHAVAAAPVAAAPVASDHDLPWWLWLLLALVLLGLVLLLVRRRKPDPVIRTRSTPVDPKRRPS